MFAAAYELGRQFTHPVITSVRYFDGTVECGLAAFVILNPEGWVVTAAHILASYAKCQQDSQAVREYQEHVAAIEQDNSLSTKRKRDKIRALRKDAKWITNHSFLWSKSNLRIHTFTLNAELDLAIGKLEPFPQDAIKVYPTLKNPKALRPGTSLCKLGYPFHQVKATYDGDRRAFNLAADTFPAPLFPIESIFTRNIIAGKTADGRYEIKFIETSSPGLRGQSGGPIMDTQGRVWGIQVRTVHLALGFNPRIRRGRQEIEENQFLNVGLGVHPEVLLSFLRDNNVDFNLSED